MWGHLLLSPGSWCAQGFVWSSNSLFPQSSGSSVIKSHWPSKSNSQRGLSLFGDVVGPRTFATVQEFLWCNWSPVCRLGGSMVGLMATSSKRTYAMHCASQVCGSRNPCLHSRPLLTVPPRETLKHSKAGLVQSLVGVTAPFSGSSWAWAFICTLQASLEVMRFDSKCDCIPHTILLGLLLCPWTRGIFLWWDPTFSCWWFFSS